METIHANHSVAEPLHYSVAEPLHIPPSTSPPAQKKHRSSRAARAQTSEKHVPAVTVRHLEKWLKTTKASVVSYSRHDEWKNKKYRAIHFAGSSNQHGDWFVHTSHPYTGALLPLLPEPATLSTRADTTGRLSRFPRTGVARSAWTAMGINGPNRLRNPITCERQKGGKAVAEARDISLVFFFILLLPSHLFPVFEGRLATPGILPEHLKVRLLKLLIGVPPLL